MLSLWQTLYLELTALLGIACVIVTIPCVLWTKKETTSAIAWCLLVFFLPILGSILYAIFGYQYVHRPLKRKIRHRLRYRQDRSAPRSNGGSPQPLSIQEDWAATAALAERYGAFPLTYGNCIRLYHDGRSAFSDIFLDMEAARDHIHLEYFIFHPDGLGNRMLDVLTSKARQGVETRLLYDAVGSRRLAQRHLRTFRQAGGKADVFLPLNLLRRRIQINLRDHRKLHVIDGTIAYCGGLNVGDEYLGLDPRFGFWRDTHFRIEGPAAVDLQRVFVENWDFAFGENLQGERYFPTEFPWTDDRPLPAGSPWTAPPSRFTDVPVQVIASGPDEDYKAIREIFFAAILRARRRVWIATPYFVPDSGLLDALCLAARSGVDVRVLCQYHPDKWIPFYAGRFYFPDVLAAGVKVYQYRVGMMHAKVMTVDGEWATVGTANFDNRSLHLNFEVNCIFHNEAVAAELERAFEVDLSWSIQLNRRVFAERPLAARLAENACRLLSPVL